MQDLGIVRMVDVRKDPEQLAIHMLHGRGEGGREILAYG